MKGMFRRALPLSLLAGSLLLASGGVRAADAPTFGPNDVRTLFYIAKSDDRDEVHYGIHLDKNCLPVGGSPVFAYWQQIEQGPNVVEELNTLDRTVYGIDRQNVAKRAADESVVTMAIRAASDRTVTISIRRQNDKCVVESMGLIAGTRAQVERVFIHIAGFLRVDWIEIRGSANGKVIVERVKH
jgi:hypothetical protein